MTNLHVRPLQFLTKALALACAVMTMTFPAWAAVFQVQGYEPWEPPRGVPGVCSGSVADGTADDDGDGLLNCWEEEGIGHFDDAGIWKRDLRLTGAKRRHKDIYVEVDSMRGRALKGSSLRAVKTAFGAVPNDLLHNPDGKKGITLHVEEDDTDLADQDWPNQFADFQLVKAVKFGTKAQREDASWADIRRAKALAYRYAISGKSHTGGRSSGLAELGGNDFMVTLGSWSKDGIKSAGGREEAEAGTFMHELGHTLGLHHGGIDRINCKPNYLSVMSYALQMPDLEPKRPLDYSRQKLDDLDENGNLDEPIGVGGPAGRIVVWGIGGVSQRGVAASGPIDWNGHGGAVDLDVSEDISRIDSKRRCGDDDGDGVQDGLTELIGYEDWAHLAYDFRASPGAADGVHTEIPIEQTAEDVLASALSIDSDGDGFSNAIDNCPAAPNPEQRDSDGDEVGDACEEVDLSITMEASPDAAAVGADLTYSIKVYNDGTNLATGVTITDTLPAGVTFVSSSPAHLCTGTATITCSIGSLDVDASETVTIVVSPDAEGEINNTARVTGNQRPDPDQDNDAATVETTVTPRLNRQPVANAGPDQTVTTAGTTAPVTLIGSTSSDPDGDPLSFEWKDAGGVAVGRSVSVALTLPIGSHRFDLTVDDGRGGSATASVNVSVVRIDPPPTVRVIAPNGGETLVAGRAYSIQWTAIDHDPVSVFDVFVSRDGGSSFRPVKDCTGVAGTETRCTWESPHPVGSNMRIKVVAHDSAGRTATDISDGSFSIEPKGHSSK